MDEVRVDLGLGVSILLFVIAYHMNGVVDRLGRIADSLRGINLELTTFNYKYSQLDDPEDMEEELLVEKG